eukprot:10611507-Ditylum_brightwellii.AAC.1
MPDNKTITVPHFSKNLPSFYPLALIDSMTNIAAAFKMAANIVPLNVLDDANSNLSHAQKEFLS